MKCDSEFSSSGLPTIEIENQPGGSNPLIPYTISPRLVFLLDNKPVLRWNEVPGASNYVVTIMRGTEIYWQEIVSSTEVIYSGTPLLEPGHTYLLTVETNNGVSSSDDNEPQFGFQLIEREIAKEVQQLVADIDRKDDFTDKEKALRKAQLFNSLNMKSEAISTLEELLAKSQFDEDSEKANIFLTLAKLDASVGLNLLAEYYYTKVITLASPARDLQILAEARTGLVEVLLILKEKSGNANQ